MISTSRIVNIILQSLLIITFLPACTMVSKEMLPGIEYRADPRIKIIEYEDHDRLQEDCAEVLSNRDWWYAGCSLVPHNPEEVCIIRIMAGNERAKQHELAHCHGYADTMLPWKADFHFHDRQ